MIAGTAPTTVTTMAVSPTVKYTFSVTPRNSASTGQPSTATMTRALAEMGTARVVPTTAAPAPTPDAAPPASAPVSPEAPATQTIYVCPTGYTENAGGLCEKAIPYTYDTKPYTYHWGVVGGHDVADAYAADMARSTGTYCPWGGAFDGTGLCSGSTYHHVDDFGNVKDPAPAGYTDTGTAWSRKNAAPASFTDDGAQWVRGVAKIAQVVSA